MESGHSYRETSRVFSVNPTTLQKWVKQYKETGSLEKKPLNRSHKKIDPVRLEAYVKAHPDRHLSEIAKEFDCSAEAVRQALKRLGITRKKRQGNTGSKTR